ncbi:hypothetical protein GQ600_8088 [Phytophthora cactorum]|nr:hypothetical protein GQ600_8088 [Phytophthora cactorum]
MIEMKRTTTKLSPSFRIWNKSRRNRLLKMVHILIATWGMVVLALHIDASLRTQLIECNPKVHPMAGALPSCFVVNFDCYRLGISGLMDEVKKEWERFDHGTVEKLQILHCSAMEVPTHIQQFHHLREIYAYNTTFVKWDANAALSGDHHPNWDQFP